MGVSFIIILALCLFEFFSSPDRLFENFQQNRESYTWTWLQLCGDGIVEGQRAGGSVCQELTGTVEVEGVRLV